MQTFACDHCSNLLWFDNDTCLRCGSAVGFARELHTLLSFRYDGDDLLAWRDDSRWHWCGNKDLVGCNWVVPADRPVGWLCDSCTLTRTRPSDGDADGLEALRLAEAAKRRLVYQADELGLPLYGQEDPRPDGLAFDLLSSKYAPVTTGHADGVITIDLAEGDDAHREALREQMAEPYRTLLGHFRHEIGHWYWAVLVDNSPRLEEFRALFGDDREDYGDALNRHYNQGPPPGWEETYVSAYATAHPWEDWAETFAHVLHIRDTLQTASAVGLYVGGPDADVSTTADAPLSALPHPSVDSAQAMIDTWLPLTYALNAVERSMGKHDLYPFTLAPKVMEKLTFAFDVVQAAAS